MHVHLCSPSQQDLCPNPLLHYIHLDTLPSVNLQHRSSFGILKLSKITRTSEDVHPVGLDVIQTYRNSRIDAGSKFSVIIGIVVNHP